MSGSDTLMQVNVSQTDLTPVESVLLAGFANRRGSSKGVHRRISTRAFVARHGRRAVCLIANDLLELERPRVERIRRDIAARTGIPEAAILLHFIHTHSAPWMERGLLDANDRYVDFATDRIVENAVAAANDTVSFRECRMRAGAGTCGISGRRGLVFPENGRPYREINAEGGHDRRFSILQFVPADGKNPVTLVNYACHPVVLGSDSVIVSPDYPGRAREVVEAAWGGTMLFFNGAAGDINPVEEGFTDPAVADRYGERLAASILDARLEDVGSVTPTGAAALDVATRRVLLPYRDRKITKGFLLREAERKGSETTEFHTWKDDLRTWAAKMSTELDAGRIGDGLPVELTAIRLGPAVLFFAQGELFNRYQVELKKRFPNTPLFVVGYANGEIGYIPDAEAFAHPGYETDMAYVYTNQPSPLTAEVERVFLDNAVATIGELTCSE